MNQRRAHWVEKVSVQLAAGAALAVMYFWLWRQVQPPDPLLPVSFFAANAGGRLAIFAGIAAAVAAIVGAATIAARPGAAIMVAILGVGGLAMRSESFRGLLWKWQGDPMHPHQFRSRR
jgi:hypothetical protein